MPKIAQCTEFTKITKNNKNCPKFLKKNNKNLDCLVGKKIKNPWICKKKNRVSSKLEVPESVRKINFECEKITLNDKINCMNKIGVSEKKIKKTFENLVDNFFKQLPIGKFSWYI